jgi:tyrosine aminotransferase
LGDPTAFGNLPPSQILTEAAAAAAYSNKYNGYVNACGVPSARAAIAKHYSTEDVEFTSDDVVIASGCSGALELALTALLDTGTNLLVPAPGFPLYEVIANSHGAGVKPYRLDPATGWECDLENMESQIDENTRGILINNPSNPCGSVFSEGHLEDIIRLAAKHKLPIVADEVYGGMTFGDVKYVPLSTVSAKLGGIAPIISSSGLAKQVRMVWSKK